MIFPLKGRGKARLLSGGCVGWRGNRTCSGWSRAQVLTLALISTCWVIMSPSLNFTRHIFFLSRMAFSSQKILCRSSIHETKEKARLSDRGWRLGSGSPHSPLPSGSQLVPKSPRGLPSLTRLTPKGLPSLE